MLKILIADDHALVRRSLIQILLEAYPAAIIGEAENGNSLINKALNGDWNIIISDISMPGINGLEALKRIKMHSPQLPVLILSYYLDQQYAAHIMKAGAAGFLSKEKALDKLTEAIRQVLSGNSYTPDLTTTKTDPDL